MVNLDRDLLETQMKYQFYILLFLMIFAIHSPDSGHVYLEVSLFLCVSPSQVDEPRIAYIS